MLITVVVMAFAVSLEPFRIGMTVLILTGPRPVARLLAFLAGGFAMGMTVGLFVLFVLRHSVPGLPYGTPANAQTLIGALVLLAAAVLILQHVTGWRIPRPAKSMPATFRLFGRGSLWTAGAAGLGTALPSVDYLAVLAVVLSSGTAVTIQIAALVLFHVVAFGLIEIAVLGSVAAPRVTRAAMVAVQHWIRARCRLEVAAALAVVGGILLAVGLAGR